MCSRIERAFLAVHLEVIEDGTMSDKNQTCSNRTEHTLTIMFVAYAKWISLFGLNYYGCFRELWNFSTFTSVHYTVYVDPRITKGVFTYRFIFNYAIYLHLFHIVFNLFSVHILD